MAFLFSLGSTNEVDTASIQVSIVSTPVSTASSHDNTTNLNDATVYAFLANQPNGSQLLHEDLEQIHEDDLKEIDLKWQLALLSMRARRSPRNQESRPRNQDSSRKTVNVEDTSSKAMGAIDGATILTKSVILPISTARHSSSRAASPVSAARLINTAASKPLVNVTQPRQNALQTSHSLSRRPFYQQTALQNRNLNNNVNTAKANSVNTAKGYKVAGVVGKQGINVVKPSACWVWRPKIKSASQDVLKDQGNFDSGCSRHMTGNISYLTNFKEHDGGMLPLEEELTMCDKKNSFLFTDTEYLVLSPNFKLADESQVLLKVPRKNNMYSFDMKNIVPQKDLTCLLAKATNDESMLWHRRLGYINFKNINKLVKDNLVRRLMIIKKRKKSEQKPGKIKSKREAWKSSESSLTKSNPSQIQESIKVKKIQL
uniref:Ribonuclease H-like domain-containing protein n=1 Tax=Tanacetum cinerariifolium TaxID=118510 RepID=A0A699GSU1_TANCI|nr:ribonuclease H-like domain-containing protein [Tanacetum cinerariifolium]